MVCGTLDFFLLNIMTINETGYVFTRLTSLPSDRKYFSPRRITKYLSRIACRFAAKLFEKLFELSMSVLNSERILLTHILTI